MNCFESRRRLLAAPRERTDEQEAHLAGCRGCAQLAGELAALDRKIIKTTRLPVPDGLSERIVLARGYPGSWHYAAGIAAAALFAAITAVTILPGIFEWSEPTVTADVVGPTHPAVAAISMVVDREPVLLREPRALNAASVEERLRIVGLALKHEGVSGRYIGKCEVAGRDCDHLVLDTAEDHVSVFLMANERSTERLVVADRRMAALVSPAPAGAYIVVGASPQAVRRAQKLLVHG